MESSSGQKARNHILIELLDADDDVSQIRTQVVIQNNVCETDYVKNQRFKRVKQRKQWEFTDILKITHLISMIYNYKTIEWE